MKKLMLVLVLVMALGQSGCAFLGGAAVGAVGTSAAYEINAHSQMSKLEDDYKAERISPAPTTDQKQHKNNDQYSIHSLSFIWVLYS